MKIRIIIGLLFAATCILAPLIIIFQARALQVEAQYGVWEDSALLETPQPPLSDTPSFISYMPMVKAEEKPTPFPTSTATPPTVWYGAGVYDNQHAGIYYKGNWYNGEGESAYLGTIKNSNRFGSQAEFHFEGRQISILYSTNTDHGQFEIWLDGNMTGYLSQTSAAWYPQAQWDSPELTAGKHSLILRHISGSVNDLDALIVSDHDYPPGPGVAPPYSTSYYMKTVNTTTHYEMGCGLGIDDYEIPGWQDNLVILDYGQPRDVTGGLYGASLFGLGPASTAQIAEAVKAFGYGYVMCSVEEPLSQLRIGVGTSNYGSQVRYAHGQAWAQMVNQINSYFIGLGFINRVIAVGANDMELDWNSVSVTRGWVDGYDSVNQYALYNFGDAGGCPSANYPYWSCNNDWRLEDVWYISYGAPPSYPLPLIYADAINAAQWHWIGLYAYNNHGRSMEFQGEMTQWQTCAQVNCYSLDNTPEEGWTYLWNYLNSDLKTAQDLRFSTDIMYHGY